MDDTIYMKENEILKLSMEDLRELSSDEAMNDNFRRMFQIMGLIYQNQLEIKSKLDSVS
jgi:hypothetical protein